MKIEKKLVVLSILAITIGVATVIPMAVLMNANAQTSPYTESVQAYGEPWLDLEITGAYFTIDTVNKENPEIPDADYIQKDMIEYKTTLNDNALSHQPEARIEYFEMTYYGDNRELLKKTFSISITDFSISITDFSRDAFPTKLFYFLDEYMMNCSTLGVVNGNVSTPHNINEKTSASGFGTGLPTDIDEYKAFLETQTVHLEIRYIGSVTFDGKNTVVSFANDQNVQQIELTKNKGGNSGLGLNSFGFGSKYTSAK